MKPKTIKKLITLLSITLSVSACDLTKGSETHSELYQCSTLDFLGTWRDNGNPDAYLYINDDCTMSLPYCESDISFTLPDADNLSIVSIHTANLAPGCVQPQDLQCQIFKSGVLFTMLCENSDSSDMDFSYTKQL